MVFGQALRVNAATATRGSQVRARQNRYSTGPPETDGQLRTNEKIRSIRAVANIDPAPVAFAMLHPGRSGRSRGSAHPGACAMPAPGSERRGERRAKVGPAGKHTSKALLSVPSIG